MPLADKSLSKDARQAKEVPPEARSDRIEGVPRFDKFEHLIYENIADQKVKKDERSREAQRKLEEERSRPPDPRPFADAGVVSGEAKKQAVSKTLSSQKLENVKTIYASYAGQSKAN